MRLNARLEIFNPTVSRGPLLLLLLRPWGGFGTSRDVYCIFQSSYRNVQEEVRLLLPFKTESTWRDKGREIEFYEGRIESFFLEMYKRKAQKV